MRHASVTFLEDTQKEDAAISHDAPESSLADPSPLPTTEDADESQHRMSRRRAPHRPALTDGNIIGSEEDEPGGRIKKGKSRRRLHVNTQELMSDPNLLKSLLFMRAQHWAGGFLRLDPRWQIYTFFNQIAQEGAEHIEQGGFRPELASPLLKYFFKASVFSVWRPTSLDAIRMMMEGRATGKGLNVKGKSAKRGILSGFVPFVQIHGNEKHKKMVTTPPKDARISVYFKDDTSRTIAVEELTKVRDEMVSVVREAKEVIHSILPQIDDDMERALNKMTWDMTDPLIHMMDQYAPRCFGIHISERLFWETYVVRQDCTRTKGGKWETGRPSEPAFQDMNCVATRHQKAGDPKTVVYQYDESKPMNPLSLLIAYEENNNVLPVASDFDAFLIGTRGVKYESQLPPNQIELVKWLVSRIDEILETADGTEPWTKKWLTILLKESKSNKGFHPKIPRFGFGDPKSYSIMETAVERLQKNGAVRHGAECFNYYFPQELDEQFLVIAESNPGKRPWRYMNATQLQEFLSHRIDEGYTFPLNPKWILTDPGWKQIYDKLLKSERPNVQNSLDAWLPKDSGVREKIAEIYEKYPNGFPRKNTIVSKRASVMFDTTVEMDLAELELQRHETLMRAKRKLRAVLFWMKLAKRSRDKLDRIRRKRATFGDDSLDEEERKSLVYLKREDEQKNMACASLNAVSEDAESEPILDTSDSQNVVTEPMNARVEILALDGDTKKGGTVDRSKRSKPMIWFAERAQVSVRGALVKEEDGNLSYRSFDASNSLQNLSEIEDTESGDEVDC
eukprot:CAMPEP_0198287866 /NCGR_PEP_ID=MMETSP1449-20131203/6552_1 /TAXON_ID=420275 /ORGANISM="Attheya septentrionalis, Strain CCMP2084" /LENGTH=792 /DNA_ID=CAMNT_0043985917 /DNA_START=125 /DNA_END=2503 /DNA_ORIENTATION=+